MEPGDARNVLTQLRRGTIEYCVLAVLADSEEYAFELVRRLSAVDGLVTSEGTIYPLLARLRRDGLVTTTWQESDAGPPRKYYQLTPAGHRGLAGFTEEAELRADDLVVGGTSTTFTVWRGADRLGTVRLAVPGAHYALDATLDTIQRFPLAYAQVRQNSRRAPLNRFPFLVIYTVEDDEIFVHACIHGKRDPRQWQRRL